MTGRRDDDGLPRIEDRETVYVEGYQVTVWETSCVSRAKGKKEERQKKRKRKAKNRKAMARPQPNDDFEIPCF